MTRCGFEWTKMALLLFALLLPMAPALAADIQVDDGCSLPNAIRSANGDALVEPLMDCEAGDASDAENYGADTIIIALSGTSDGVIALADTLHVDSHIEIQGAGHTISGGLHRIFDITDGSLVLHDLTLTAGYNESHGGAIDVEDASLRLDNSVVKASGAPGRGGGIRAHDSDVTLIDSVVSNNMTGPSAFAGVEELERARRQNTGDAQLLEAQSAEHDEVDMASIEDSNGGGIYFDGQSNTLTISRSGLDNNSSAGSGGGIYLASGELVITDSTISLNGASASGGGLHNAGEAILAHVTVVGNSAASGGGLLDDAQLQLLNSILHNNAGGDCSGALNANIGNIIGDDSCGHDGLHADPNLLLLQGLPMYYQPQPGSPAIDSASSDYCTEMDQRGIARIPSACDIGAAEHQAGVFRFQIQSALALLDTPDSGGDTESASGAPDQATAATSQPSNCASLPASVRVNGYHQGTGCLYLDAAGVGNQTLIDGGFIVAVDIHGAIPPGLSICFQAGSGAIVLLDAANAPRNIVPLRTWTSGAMKCAAIDRAGSAVLMPLGFFVSGAIPEPIWDVGDCSATTTDILNLRSGPSSWSEVVAAVLNGVVVSVTQRATYYSKVTYYNRVGWLSSDYLVFKGNCE